MSVFLLPGGQKQQSGSGRPGWRWSSESWRTLCCCCPLVSDIHMSLQFLLSSQSSWGNTETSLLLVDEYKNILLFLLGFLLVCTSNVHPAFLVFAPIFTVCSWSQTKPEPVSQYLQFLVVVVYFELLQKHTQEEF